MKSKLFALCLVLLASAPLAAQIPLRVRMLQAEDARGTGPDGVAALDEGLRSRDPQVRRQAVRALGRIERADLIAKVAPVVDDPDPRVQAQAIDALGQLARGSAAVAEVQALLLAMEPRVGSQVWPVLAATLGRLPYETLEQVRRAETALGTALPNGADRTRGVDALVGATRGLEALIRQSRKIAPPTTATIDGLRAVAIATQTRAEGDATPGDGDQRKLVNARRLAWLALGTLGNVDDALVARGLADADEEVRRLAVASLASDAAVEDRGELLQRALKDANPRVRYEALRVWGRELQKTSCAPVQAALRDAAAHVMLLAIDLLGAGCPKVQDVGGAGSSAPPQSPVRRGGSLDPPEPAAKALLSIAMVLTGQPGGWHGPAHALVSLARVAPAEARPLLPKFATHQIWQVRMYAARAAGVLGAVDELRALAGDRHDNVREAAIGALAELKRPETVTAAVDALSRRDYQLVMTAARALELTPADDRDRVATALLAALERLTAEKRDTSRDPRMAILERLQVLGGESHAPRLEPYLRDFDPRVAAKAAEVLAAWTGVTRVPDPQPLPRPPIDTALLGRLSKTTLRVTIAGKGHFTLRLLDDEAPLSLLRVVSRAREGYYNGLTFHRVAANFVIQGGSPGANEYMGDGPYMRDEVGLISHTRGTVGISTRGRDTGDAQIFVNLIDSPRLDHTYTVLAEVVDGMDVVDRILEGDVIERID